ncbi:MAG TPA: S53 family peptidase [Candidatus Acidoferrales bacterium]|jgi:subtilase family serine protease|nr:S53 family peptidase [Candidatus Acidoferrales bacterium]
MRPKYLLSFLAVLFLAVIPLIPSSVSGQSGVASRIRGAIDNTKLTALGGNVHPMARSEFDRGAAAASLPMEHMQLVLTRSADEETALETLLAQQQNPSSPNYHNWLTPEQSGQQFGASDQDVQKITAWLQSQGFHVNEVAKGRGTIDFSGNAGEVQQAFHTSIHRYVMADGVERWANSTDPQIPAALAPVVAGVHSLNSFPRKPMSHRAHPNVTLGGNCNGNNTNCYAVGPTDFATIYNSQALLTAGVNGSGQTIAIVADSDINSADVNNFRSLFGLSAVNLQRIIPTSSTNPGIQNNSNNSDEVESVLDVEWAGAVAPGATIDLVLAPTTNTAFGGDTAAIYIVDNNLAPILSYSYGACELALGTSGNLFYQNLWSQAASEGITVLVSTGDSGAAGCDDPNQNLPADFGLQVNGVGSTPFNIAVGGTDFNDFSNPTTYWNNSNSSSGLVSAKSYIPEIAYNDSCANSVIYTNVLNFSSAEAGCNSSAANTDKFLAPAGGSGGVSNCTTNSTTGTTVNLNASSCSGGYAKPSWQTGVGVPADGKRDVPDLSLFAGDGTIQNFYLMCQSDQNTNNAACTSTPLLQGVGGTSVSVQAFAGITALINQQTGGRQGNFNPTLYSLAAAQSASSCNSTSNPSTACVFYDTTVGTVAMDCDAGTPNCVVNTTGDSIGILSGFNAGVGFDLATGLGSVNIGNLINKFPNFSLSSSVTTFTVSSTSPGTSTVTVTSQNGFSGTVQLTCSGLPTGASCKFGTPSVTLAANGTATSTLTITKPSGTLTPSLQRNFPNNPILITGVVTLLMLGFLTIFRTPQRSVALALIAFAALLTMAACSGSSSSSTNSSSSTSGSSSSSSSSGNASIAGTNTITNGSTTYTAASHALAITVTVQ